MAARSPNALFARWIREWRREARSARARAAYGRALRSLSRYPLPLRSGRAAAILQHFGPALCARLDQRLSQHRRELGLPATPPRRQERCPAPPPAPPARPLAEQDENCAPSPPLVSPRGSPGLDLGSPRCDPEWDFELQPGHFDIVLCADVTEAHGPSGGLPALLRSRGVPVLLRRLPVGDFLWVARERDPPAGHAPRELVLDVVVERKSAADLGNSIRDGRYREQKLRLRRSGLRFPVLLLEQPGEGEALPLPPRSLRQAAASAQVRDGLFVARARDPQDAAEYLGVLGEQLRRRFGGRRLRSWGGGVTTRGPPEPPGTPLALLPLPRLREGGGKNQTVGAVFARQLLQLRGLGGGRAGAVQRRFPTPASLLAALGPSQDPQKCREVLRGLSCGPAQRNLGPSLSEALVQLYGTLGPLS
ncbi:structure-specific endonuclease subunit MUS81 [Lonchura striata]